MNSHLLQDEAMTAWGAVNGFNALLPTGDYDRMVAEVEKLSNGVFEPVVEQFLTSRRALMQATRRGASDFVKSRPELKIRCASVSFEDFMRLTHPLDRFKMLREHLSHEFTNADTDTLNKVTAALLRNPGFRVAHTMVRADMYVTWRAARAGVLARDIQDDCYHLVNSCYCEVYATKDAWQAQYAPNIVGPATVRLYDGYAPLSDWLVSIASE
jgi:hypothetical protein